MPGDTSACSGDAACLLFAVIRGGRQATVKRKPWPGSIVGLASTVALQGRRREGFRGPRLPGVFAAPQTMHTSWSRRLCVDENSDERRALFRGCERGCAHSRSEARLELFIVDVK